MREGAVLVDVAIDQGGCAENSQANDACCPNLCRGVCDPLLCYQYAQAQCRERRRLP